MNKKAVSLPEVFDADLEDLMNFRGKRFVSEEVAGYAEIYQYYLTGDIERLRECVLVTTTKKENSPDYELSALLGKARLELRTRKFEEKTWIELNQLAANEGIWLGEILFILSSFHTMRDEEKVARDFSRLAAVALKKVGAKKKAVRSLMNALAAESRLYPDRHYLSDLYYVYREAKRCGDRISIGNTLMNLSREYQKLGAQSVALKYANRAIAKLSLSAGNLNYFSAIAHRCHIFCQMGSFSEARMDAEVASVSPFPEIHRAVEIIRVEFPQLAPVIEPKSSSTEPASPTWKERLGEKPALKLSRLEQKLTALVAEQPRSAQELIDLIYGDLLPPETTRMRLDNLLYRIRKRDKKLIIFSEGKYRLGDS